MSQAKAMKDRLCLNKKKKERENENEDTEDGEGEKGEEEVVVSITIRIGQNTENKCMSIVWAQMGQLFHYL